MKRNIVKSFLLLSVVMMTVQISSNDLKRNVTYDLEHVLKSAIASDGESGYSCTATSSCGIGSSVSCTGQTCERGTGWVKCDGKKTTC